MMQQKHKHTRILPPSPQQLQQNDLSADLTLICWTQVLRATESEDSPPLRLPPLQNDSSDDALFS